MIIGIGCDLLETERFERSAQRASFMSHCFSAEELETLKPRQLAGNFAAKEAFAKALGTGVRGFALNEISVLRDELGAPYFRFCGAAAEIVAARGARAAVSISNIKSAVCAFVILEDVRCE